MEEFIIANCTDTGKVRTVNEDSMTTFDSPNGRVVVVCDGMGGQNAGDVASQLAVTVIQDLLTDNKFNSPEEAITKSIIAANQAILMRAAQDVSLSGMGATCVMLIITGGNVYYGSVGDSRIYVMAGGMLRQLTKDQSYVQTLVDAGELTQEAAEHHQDKNQITNALGLESMTPPVLGQLTGSAVPGSVFLLCSDGLSGMVNNNLISKVLSNPSMSLQDKADELVKMANEAGGVDNITVQLVQFAGASGNMGTQPMPYGSNVTRKPGKSSAIKYWMTTIVCLILAIGGGTYWLITKDNEAAKQSSPTATEQTNKSNKSNKTSAPSTKPKAAEPQTPKVEEVTTIKYVEKKTSKKESKKETKEKGGKSTNNQKIEDKVTENQDNPDTPPEVIMNKVDNRGEKND